jgi:nitrogen PTS system EIIA component
MMKSILTAIEEGRLIELSTDDKAKALEYLAILLEAIPGIGSAVDIVKEVMERETLANTGIGKGIACPHMRTKQEEGELLCAIGWSPHGIDYGAPDGQKVHIVIMYYIPESKRNFYLKEISGLAKSVEKTGGVSGIEGLTDLATVRNRLLDWVELTVSEAVPDAKARMIRLEQRTAAATAIAGLPAGKWTVIPFSMVILESGQPKLLVHDATVLQELEKAPEFSSIKMETTAFMAAGYQVTVTASTLFSGNRKFFECVAVRPENP